VNIHLLRKNKYLTETFELKDQIGKIYSGILKQGFWQHFFHMTSLRLNKNRNYLAAMVLILILAVIIHIDAFCKNQKVD